MSDSIMQEEKVCYVTRSTVMLDKHHCLNGPLRQKADDLGLWVWLRHDVHMMLHSHMHPYENLYWDLKREAQKAFEREHSREEWMSLIGRSYLGDDDE